MGMMNPEMMGMMPQHDLGMGFDMSAGDYLRCCRRHILIAFFRHAPHAMQILTNLSLQPSLLACTLSTAPHPSGICGYGASLHTAYVVQASIQLQTP